VNPIILHHAPRVVPISHPVLIDGAVAVNNGRIIDVGPFADLQSKYPEARIAYHPGCVLLPPLINAHMHLELSHIRIPEETRAIRGFTDWIGKLLETRQQAGILGETVETAAREALREQSTFGVAGIGDIGNTDLGERLAENFTGLLLHFHEMLGRSQKTRKNILFEIAVAEDSKHFTAHAPYSTHAELIQALKKRAGKLNHPFPIHTAEPPSESEMLSSGSGELFNFLMQLGFIDKSYRPPAEIDNQGSVRYLHKLGVLDRRTICVHCVHLADEEIQILADTKTRVCLCPGSNRYLQVGRAPVKKFLDHGILPALGTDSRASNPELSLWREMRILHEDNPGVQPEDILAMATLGGAEALGIDHDYGTLEKGKKAHFLAVMIPESVRAAKDIFSFLATDNSAIQPVWIHEK